MVMQTRNVKRLRVGPRRFSQSPSTLQHSAVKSTFGLNALLDAPLRERWVGHVRPFNVCDCHVTSSTSALSSRCKCGTWMASSEAGALLDAWVKTGAFCP